MEFLFFMTSISHVHVRTIVLPYTFSTHVRGGRLDGEREQKQTHHSIEVLHHALIQQIIDNEKKNNNLYHITRTEFCQRFLKYRKNQLITIDTTFTIAQV